jgi:hypothetical protein
LYLGKRALSTSKTLGPRRAISSAAIDPAGPAPTTTTSQDVSAMSERKSSLDAASAEPRVHREHPHFVDRERAFYGARSVVYAHVVAKQHAHADLSEPEPCPTPDEIMDENQAFGCGCCVR